MNTLEGLFDERLGGVGQKRAGSVALKSKMDFEARLEGCGDSTTVLINTILMIAEDIHAIAGGAAHQRFTKHKLQRNHFCVTAKLKLYWSQEWPDVAFYLEHPETGKLLPIVNAMPDRRSNGFSVVWVTCMSNEPMVVSDSTLMYVSDEPDVAGKTLDQVRKRYGKDK